MVRIRDMQGVPAHLEYLRTNDGIHRHPAHCIFAEGKGKNRICTSPQCQMFNKHCNSAAKCDYYEQKDMER